MKNSIIVALAAAGLALTAVPAAFAAGSTTAQPNVVNKTIYVMADDMGLVGPDKQHHDSFIPSSFVLKAGETVHLTFVNYDDMMHTFTDPALNINVIVKAAKHTGQGDAVTPTKTTYTFTPTKTGQFRWHCNVPCDKGDGNGWAMKAGADGHDQDGYMAGYVVVI